VNALLEAANRVSETWWATVLHAGWQSAIVGGLILAVVACGRRWPAPVRYWLLVVALLKFAVPPLWSAPTGLFSYVFVTASAASSKTAALPIVDHAAETADDRQAATALADQLRRQNEKLAGALATHENKLSLTTPVAKLPVDHRFSEPAVSRMPAMGWKSMLMGIHLLGTACLVAWVTVQLVAVRRIITCARRANDGRIAATLDRANRCGPLRRPVRVLVSPVASAPVALGVVWPTIVLPESSVQLSDRELEAILLHELSHLRQGDAWINWLQVLLCAAWWFHPVIWLVHRSLRRVREDRCDDVILLSGVATESEYCATLLRVARDAAGRPADLVACHMAHRLHPLSQRLRRIMDPRVRRSLRLSAAGALAIVVLACLVLPGLGQPSKREKAKALTASEAADEKGPIHPDPKMAEIIRAVRVNEARYRDLETVIRTQRQIPDEHDAKKFTVAYDHLRHVIRQGDLFYFHGEDVRLQPDGKTLRHERISAFDGEKTRSVDYGQSANIHIGPWESQYVYPPHSWALFAWYINFPLSVYLQGTEAIQSDAKLHRFPFGVGSVFDFPIVETAFDGKETIDGLKCVRIRCQRRNTRKDPPGTQLLWLATERNYLCIKSQLLFSQDDPRPPFEATVNELREIAPGLWLPARVTVKTDRRPKDKDAPVGDAVGGKMLPWIWTDTLNLEQAVLKPGRPASFFHDVKIPEGIPVYTIEGGRLSGGGFEQEPPWPESDKRVAELIEKIRTNEKHYENLEVVREQTYRHLNDVDPFGGMRPAKSWKKVERSAIHGTTGSYSEEGVIESNDDKPIVVSSKVDFDGKRLRTSSVWGTTSHADKRVVPVKEGMAAVPVHRPHALFYRDARDQAPLSDHLSSPTWGGTTPQKVTWLGEDDRDGLRCDVLRRADADQSRHFSTFALIWLARDRNYLPIRMELYQANWSKSLPIGVMTAEDLREIAPGIWFPYVVKEFWNQTWNETPIAAGVVVVERRTDYVVRSVVLNGQGAKGKAANENTAKPAAPHTPTSSGSGPANPPIQLPFWNGRPAPPNEFLRTALADAEPAKKESDNSQAFSKRVRDSVASGQAYLSRQQNADGSFGPAPYNDASAPRALGVTVRPARYPIGTTALATLALLESGRKPDDPIVAKSLQYLRSGRDPQGTYEVSLEIAALVAARQWQQDLSRIARLAHQLEITQLTEASQAGMWNYGRGQLGGGNADNSNTQYAVMGLRAAARAGVPVKRETWQRVAEHFVKSQNSKGGWGYQNGGTSTGSMTCGAIASLVICDQILVSAEKDWKPDGTLNCSDSHASDLHRAVEWGRAWLDRYFAVGVNPGHGTSWLLHYHWLVARAGRLSGARFFGRHDWYQEIATFLMEGQARRDGSWRTSSSTVETDSVLSTSFALLFLPRGSEPVLIGKLKYGSPGDAKKEAAGELPNWNSHPADGRNLTDYISRLPGWPRVTYEEIDLNQAAGDNEGAASLMRAPILLISGSESPRFTDSQVRALRGYIDRGGVIFVVNSCLSPKFDEGIRGLASRIFASDNAPLRRLPPEELIYRSEYPLDPEDFELLGVQIGGRTPFLCVPQEISCLWSKWSPLPVPQRTAKMNAGIIRALRLGANVAAYATGRKPPRDSGTSQDRSAAPGAKAPTAK